MTIPSTGRPLPLRKTAEEHLDMLRQSVQLMLWHAFRWKTEHPEEKLEEILDKRVDIFRRTELHDGEIFDFMYPEVSARWQSLKGELIAVAAKCSHPEAFEAQAFPLIEPLLEARVERDLNDLHTGKIFAQYTQSCLHFGPTFLEEGTRRIDFHIANSKYPGSIFDDHSYIPECLLRMADKAEEEIGCVEISTNTWLNSFPGWTRFFPPVWMERMSPERIDTEDHLGYWGQFLTGRQTFAEATGKKMRKLGRVPYAMRRSWCTIAELREFYAARAPSIDVVAALIRNGDRFFICQRPTDKGRALEWEFPGGKIEPGESPEEALVRECREELSVEVRVGALYAETTHRYPDLFIRLRLYETTVVAGTLQNLEHNDQRWITPDQIDQFEFCPADLDFIRKLKSEG